MSRVRGEEGIALPVAIMSIVLIGILSAVLASTSVQLNDSSSRDRDSKRALAAAEAGMSTALDRLNRLLPLDSQALADGPVTVLASAQAFDRIGFEGGVTIQAGQSPPSSDERSGNGGTFHYYVSPALGASANGCNNPVAVGAGTSHATLLASGVTLLERCITSVGVVNGTIRRVQRKAYSTLQLFDGFTLTQADDADDALYASGGADLLTSRVDSMGRVRMNGAAYSGQITRHRTAPAASMTSVTGAWTETTTERPYVLTKPVPPGTNDNASIGCVGPVTDLLCSTNRPIGSDDVLRVRTNYTVTLTGNIHVCDVAITGGTLAVTGTASVWVDHRSRSGSHCQGVAYESTNGRVSITGGIVNAPAGVGASVAAPNLRFYVHGPQNESLDPSAVNINAGLTNTVNALFYAPDGRVSIAGQSLLNAPTVTGAVSARQARVSQYAKFMALPSLSVSLEPGNLLGRYEPGDWVECERQFTGGKPHGDCRS